MSYDKKNCRSPFQVVPVLGFSHFFACRKLSNILSLKSMYPIGSEMIVSTFSGNDTSSTLPGITIILSCSLLCRTSCWKHKQIHLQLITMLSFDSVLLQINLEWFISELLIPMDKIKRWIKTA